MLTPWMSLKASLMASLRASTSPIMGYGGGGGGTNGSTTGTTGSILVGSPRDGSGAGLYAALFGDPGGVLKGESLPIGDDAGVRKILTSTSPASEESESLSTGKYAGVGSNKGCSGLPPARIGSIHWKVITGQEQLVPEY